MEVEVNVCELVPYLVADGV